MGAVVGEIVVVGVFTAKAGKEAEFEGALRALIKKAHEEPGCVRYALHRSLDDPAKLVMVERWASREALDEHVTRPYMRDAAGLGELLAGMPVMVFCEPLPEGDAVKGAL
jgi:quinol monooxygenase YgiN